MTKYRHLGALCAVTRTGIESAQPFFAVCCNIEKTPKLRRFRAIQKN